MSPIDVVAIVILIVAILVLVYYYLQNNPASVQKLRTYVPTTADPHMGEILQNDSDYDDLSREKDTVEESKEEESMSRRIKIKLSDNLVGGVIGKDRNIDLYNKARRFEKDRICCIIPVTESGWEDYVACDQFVTKLVPNNVVPLIEPSKDSSHKAEWGVNSNGIHYMES